MKIYAPEAGSCLLAPATAVTHQMNLQLFVRWRVDDVDGGERKEMHAKESVSSRRCAQDVVETLS